MILRCPTCLQTVDADPDASRGTCATCGEVFAIPKSQKLCSVCGVDAADARYTGDGQTKDYCRACWTEQVANGREVDLRPVVIGNPGDPGTSLARVSAAAIEGMRAAATLPRALAPRSGEPLVVYVAPAPQAAKERSRAAFLAGFYGAAGVLTALVLVAMGLGVYGAASLYLNKPAHAPSPEATTPQSVADVPLEQEPVVAASDAPRAEAAAAMARSVRLDAVVSPDGSLRVAARNISARSIPDVKVEVLSGDGTNSLGTVFLGTLSPGATRRITADLPALRAAARSGDAARVRVVVNES